MSYVNSTGGLNSSPNSTTGGGYLLTGYAVATSGNTPSGMSISHGTSVALHNTTNVPSAFLGGSFQTTGTALTTSGLQGGNPGCIFIYRADVTAGTTFSPSSSDAAGPYVDLSFTGVANVWAYLVLYVVPLTSGPSGSGPAVSIAIERKDAVAVSDIRFDRQFDGVVTSRVESTRPLPPRRFDAAAALASGGSSTPSAPVLPVAGFPVSAISAFTPSPTRLARSFELLDYKDEKGAIVRVRANQLPWVGSNPTAPLTARDARKIVETYSVSGEMLWGLRSRYSVKPGSPPFAVGETFRWPPDDDIRVADLAFAAGSRYVDPDFGAITVLNSSCGTPVAPK
jgi:hypothetical protein